jgi:exopolyphosphatase/guanosine-5'-triphosphate,3'-diphosphate pyrophosphatase
MDESVVVAAVDIGTNSVKLTVAETRGGGGLSVLADATRVTRLGKGVDGSGRLAPEAVERTLGALAEFAGRARDLGAVRVAAVGTSALRDAANGADFVAEAARVLGGPLEIISGDREAHLVHAAARRDPDLRLPEAGPLAVMDIGGGSTEFVLGHGSTITFRDSLQLGAVRLTERALPGDPPAEGDVRRAIEIVDEILAEIPAPPTPAAPAGSGVTLVGSGGTIANLAAMEKGLPEFAPQTLHGMRLSRAQIDARVDALAARTVAERRGIPGLEPDRADVILAGAIIQARALHRLGADEVIVSVRGLRYGLLYELADAPPA